MKVVLFCGGFGLRLRDHEPRIPKPVVPLGDDPLVLHVMRYYAHFGYTDFLLCLGYKGEVVQESVEGAVMAQLEGARSAAPGSPQDMTTWTVQFVDTGLHATIAERLMAVKPYLPVGERFFANYSDSLTDAPLPDLVSGHESKGAIASFVCVKPHLSLHHVSVDEPSGRVTAIQSIRDAVRINGGYFTLDYEVFDYIEPGDELVERPFARLITEGRLHGHVYDGFWSTVDTYKDHMRLSTLLQQGPGPWQLWRQLEATSYGAAGS